VTHQLQYLQDVKHIVVMNAGRIQIQGSYDEIKASEDKSGLNSLGSVKINTQKEENLEDENDEIENEVSLTMLF
jgi:ABC-type methionine transport system ATPase subunit